MSAQSAPQVPASPLHHVRGAALHVRGTLAILVMSLVMAGAAWMLERGEAAGPALAESTLPIAAEPAAPVVAAPAVRAAAPAVPVAAPPVRVAATAAPVEQKAASESTPSRPVTAPQPAAVRAEVDGAADNRRYRALAEFLAKRYRVSQTVTLDLVSIAHAAGQQIGIDPLLIIAVIAVESRFNPIAESVMGAKGLMQIIPKYHSDKFQEFGGVKTVFDPETNILVGSQIIKEYLVRTGNLNHALQLYGGVSSRQNMTYFEKVMSEKQRLQQVLRRSS